MSKNDYDKIKNFIFKTELDIAILINNAAEFQHEALNEISPDNLLRASVVNCHAPSLLARYFVPKMLERHGNVSINHIVFISENQIKYCLMIYNLRVQSQLSLTLERTVENFIIQATNLPFLAPQKLMFMPLATKWER